MHKPEPRFPPPIDLQGELLLNVFTHRSLRQDGGSGDNERYAALGEKVFEASVTYSLFTTYPALVGKDIEERRAALLTDHNYEQWTKYYRLRDKLRFHSDAYHQVQSPEGAREIFHAYIGGAYTQTNGPLVVNRWVEHLVVPPEDRPKPEEKVSSFYASQPPPPSYPYPVQPPPPPVPPPTLPQDKRFSARSRTSSFSSARNVAVPPDDPLGGRVPYTTSTTGKSIYLPRFNEITTQRRLHVEYPAEQKGLQHAPRWVVTCVGAYRTDTDALRRHSDSTFRHPVNGQQMGIGAATTKQLAKEEAAKQAFHALNFTMPPGY
ncbi:hypothetical protein JB92DRAFT_1295642 [Gautieria morchelliformis]|nr:hypothetical protein JB92DRAFT_1295642 [Gautieria morchelliformis]